jgi:DNA-binding beta-propeller fold protein YncE
VTVLDGNTLTFVNGSFGITSTVPVSATPTDIALNSAGTTAYVTSVDGPDLAVIDVVTATKQRTMAVAGSARVLLSPDGSLLYVGKPGGVDVLSTATGSRELFVVTGGRVNGIALSADGSTLWVSNDFSGKLYRIKTSTMQVTDSLFLGGVPQEVVYHGGSGNVFVANEAGWVDVVNGTTFGTVARFGGTSGAFGMRLTADGSKLYVAGGGTGQVYVLDRSTGSLLKTISVGGVARRILFMQDGRAAVANEGGYVSLLP